MILTDILDVFRAENPELTERVISDVLLKLWAKQGDKEICALTRCIVDDYTFNSIVSSTVYTARYDLISQIPKFYDIDDFPGGGVSFDDDPLEKTSVAELDAKDSTWRERSAGTPEKYYRRGKYLYFDYPVLTADLEIRVYASLVSDDFTGDNSTPYNGLTYLEPYHYGIVKFLQWKAKQKVGKPNEAIAAQQEYSAYITFMKSQLGGNKFSPIKMRPEAGAYHNPNLVR
jgi:hypothetical protein